MKRSLTAGLVAGLLAVAAAPAHAAPTVTVRVEGANATLLERTTVTLDSTGVPGTSCTGDTAGAALDKATQGNWDRQEFASTILGERHQFDNSDYWAEWVDRGGGYKRGAGLCSDHLIEGDEVLMLVDLSPPPSFAPTVFPLDLEGVPTSAVSGATVTLTVVEYRSPTGDIGEGIRTPVAGATVTGGAAAVTTGADGTAVVTLGPAGPAVLKATKPGDAPSAGERITVTAAGSPQPAAPQTVVAPDRTPPTATLTGLTEKAVLDRGPRQLSGRFAADPSGIKMVKLRLTKRLGKRCWYFSGRMERFRRAKCGNGAYFRIGDQATWSYLLPERLTRGRYVLDAIAIDGAFNRTPLARGTTRVVFTVR
jgi:hypothetical protein